MRVIAFVGPSGTGKSYRSVMVSQQYGETITLRSNMELTL